MLDQPRAIRSGEELDRLRLEHYLKEQMPDLEGDLALQQFPSGFSNLTYHLRFEEKEFVLRRPPQGVAIKSAHDMGREFRVLSGLVKVYDKVPKPLLYCDDTRVLGAPFYVMERVTGVVLRPGTPALSELPGAKMNRLSSALVDNLAAIHALDIEAAGLSTLGRPQGYIRRQIEGWARRYDQARTDEIPQLERLAAWLHAQMPVEQAAAIIHNDYKFDNVVLDGADLARIIAVLDWEMCTLGDPWMDLGTTLGYWVEADDPPAMAAMFGLTTLPGALTREQVVDRYCTISTMDATDPLFYYAYGLFKIAVIIQQIYTRYRQGHTQDPRFASLIDVVRACGSMGARAVELGRISALG